ncbi:MAG TPA: serine hydrolase domain-containing protein [Patescibacteria group bacterium]|nr:serine hydrolase domain-containing protein [Patescibacteria group bacterium]
MSKVRILCSGLVLTVLALFALSVGSAAAKTSLDQTLFTARTQIWQAIASGQAGSATAAIMDNGVLVYAEGFGMADRARSIPVKKDTLFNIGSISKMHCATAIMLLVDDGKLKLDKPVSAYLPEFTMADERYRDITVRMLLNHASGLPGTVVPFGAGYEVSNRYPGYVLETLAQSQLKHRPGEMAPYCNDGFTLAEMVVARVSGKSYLDFVSERILQPLALYQSGPSVGQRREKDNAAIAHFYDVTGREEPPEALAFLGAGGLSGTAEDLCKFADSFAAGGRHILSSQSWAEMLKPQLSEFAVKLREPGIQFGLGWDVAAVPFGDPGIRVYGKSGGTSNYSSMLYTVPDKRISVAVMFTGERGPATGIAESVLAAYLLEKGYIKKEEKAVEPPLAAEPIPAELAAYAGEYSSGGSLVRIKVDLPGKNVKLFKVENGTETLLSSAIYNNGYFHSAEGLHYFATVDGRQVWVSRSGLFGDNVACEKLEPVVRPQTLRVAVRDKQWLWRNAQASEGNGISGAYVVTSGLIESLPGYIDFAGPKRVETPISAGPAIHTMRDLTELALVEKSDDTWVWLSGMLYMPAESARVLSGATAEIRIAQEGYNEWLRLAENAILSFRLPDRSRLIVFGSTGAVLYDSVSDKGEVYVPAGSFIEVAGSPGIVVEVKAAYP